MTDPIEEYFKEALRIQVLVHTGKLLCRNCQDPIDDDDKDFCGMCREMGCTNTSGNHKSDQALTDVSNSSGIRNSEKDI